MKVCSCRLPIESVNPRKEGFCAACALRLPPGSDQLGPFLDRLADAIPGAVNPKTGKPSATWAAFRKSCEERERVGRERFGFAFYRRNNIREASEEAWDGANYAAFDHIVQTHREGEDGDVDLALTAAAKFFEAFEALAHLRAKRHHAP